MGTNYYFCTVDDVGFQHKLHIGKSSAGWVFAVRIHPEREIQTLADWVAVWARGGEIRDEYEQLLSVPEMLSCIKNRKRVSAPEPQDLVANSARIGPNNLFAADPALCRDGSIRSGAPDETWEYHDFS